VANHAHALQICVKLKSSVNFAFMPSLAVKAKDNVWISMGLVEIKPAKKKSFNLHWISD